MPLPRPGRDQLKMITKVVATNRAQLQRLSALR